MLGATFVIPVRNGARWLDRVLAAICAQRWTGPVQIIAVDDGSTDGSLTILSRYETRGGLRVLTGAGTGAAAALNLGVRAAAHPLIAQVDQDVVIAPDWLARLVPAFDDPRVAAAQGRYIVVPRSPCLVPRLPFAGSEATESDVWSRVMALDLGLRYDRLGVRTNHVCTGNSVYRRSALVEVGMFDETLGYGYDNDVSYRLVSAGHHLAYRRNAESVHYWRKGIVGYAQQQYGFGYGRLNLLARHPNRAAGDDVSRLSMMLQAPVTALAISAALVAGATYTLGVRSTIPAVVALALAAIVVIERFAAGLVAAVRYRDLAGLCFVPVHVVRNIAWVAAMIAWSIRTLSGSRPRPAHSMRPRSELGGA